MAQTWKYAIGLGLLGGALVTGCVVKTDGDGNIGDAGEGGTGGSGGSTGGSGGSTGGKGGSGTGGATGGSSGKGGTGGTTGGSAGKGGGAGTGGSTGGSAGTGGSTGGGAGTSAAGTGGTDMQTYECDPASGNLDNTPFPDCEPSDPENPTDCETCVQESCCEESKACYSFDPGNVCGWGGPSDGEFAGAGEIGCYVQCLAKQVEENGVCDDEAIGTCIGECQTTACGDVLGTQTSDLAACIHTSCNQDCFGIDTCG